jgi:hypothetical protein
VPADFPKFLKPKALPWSSLARSLQVSLVRNSRQRSKNMILVKQILILQLGNAGAVLVFFYLRQYWEQAPRTQLVWRCAFDATTTVSKKCIGILGKQQANNCGRIRRCHCVAFGLGTLRSPVNSNRHAALWHRNYEDATAYR